MGGRALNFETRRVYTGEFWRLAEKVRIGLAELYPDCETFVLTPYRQKPDHGDIDILIKTNRSDFSKEDVMTKFGSKDFSRNSNVWSLDIEGVQIDLCFTTPENWETSCKFFSYNDNGLLLGRIYHKMGLKFGHRGLSYVVRDVNNQPFEDISVSKNWGAMLNLIGLSEVRYEKGFDALEDIFEFVAGSRYFHPDIYLLNNLNNENRVRNVKRVTFVEFLIWCKENNDSLNHFEFPDNKDVWLPILKEYFPDFNQKLVESRKRLEERRMYKSKFNGELVKEWTGLEGRELGNFMAYFLKEFGGKEDLKKHLLLPDFSVEPLVKLSKKIWDVQNNR